MKLSALEKRELDKFTKFLALKCTQIIVQSRLGEKVSTNSRPQTTGTDWFNLNISDLSEVLAETKRVLHGEILTSNLPLCIEISLLTSDDDRMVLENWCLGMLPEQCDPTTRIVHTIYNRMGTLLKSLVSITRVVPAYKLSRRQSPDSFVICYRIYLGEPLLQCLGEDFNQVQIGQICTPIGTLSLSVAYRTKMTISPTQNSIMLKSDHFNTKSSPKSRRNNQNEDTMTPLNTLMKLGAFAERKKVEIPSRYIIPDLPFKTSKFLDIIKAREKKMYGITDKVDNDAKEETVENEKQETNGNTAVEETTTSLKSLTMEPTSEDYILVDLNLPFATPSEKNELGGFYREWKRAPSLETFVEITQAPELEVFRELETYDSDLTEFDTVVQSFCQAATK